MSEKILTGQKSTLDRTKSGALRVFDRTQHVTRARIERGQLTSSLERGEKPVQNERVNSNSNSNSNSARAVELPVHDLGNRQRRESGATSIRESLTKFLVPPAAKVPAP